MVCKLAYKLPLRRCECGGKPSLRCLPKGSSYYNGDMWFVECDRIPCYKRVIKLYRSPLVTVIKWNLKNWRFTKETNKYLKGEK